MGCVDFDCVDLVCVGVDAVDFVLILFALGVIVLVLVALANLAFEKNTCSNVIIEVKAGWNRMKQEAPSEVRDLRLQHIVGVTGKRNYGALVAVTPTQFAFIVY